MCNIIGTLYMYISINIPLDTERSERPVEKKFRSDGVINKYNWIRG